MAFEYARKAGEDTPIGLACQVVCECGDWQSARAQPVWMGTLLANLLASSPSNSKAAGMHRKDEVSLGEILLRNFYARSKHAQMLHHQFVRLSPKPRGFHLITREIMEQVVLPKGDGLLLLLLQHTSAGLCLNENADPDVRHDLDLYFEQLAPEHMSNIKHTIEGPDDMPAHVKAILSGVQLILPFRDGQMLLGTWQGIYLCEFRNRGGSRQLVATVMS